VEFWQLLIGTISGFIIAFLAEPVKTYFTNKSKRANLRAALHAEMAQVYLRFANLAEKLEKDTSIADRIPDIAKKNARFSCYEYTKEKELPIFYQLEEASAIDGLYTDWILVTSEESLKSPKHQLPIANDVCTCFEDALKLGEINKKLLLRKSSPHFRKLLEKRLSETQLSSLHNVR
jgi:hypothetical protein